jgi:hypothetical protein
MANRPGSGSLTECPPSLNGRGRDRCQHRRLFVPAVQAGLADILRHATPDQQTMDAPLDRAKQAVHLLVGRWRGSLKAQGPTVVFDIHAVEHERMHVHVQVQRSAKPLDDRHGPATAPDRAVLPRPPPKRAEHRTHEHTRDRPTQLVVPCEHVTQLVRQAQDPLAHRHFWKYVIDQVRCSLRHSSPAAARTDGPALTGERDKPIETARAAVKAREPASKKSAAQEPSKLLLDESRHAVPFVGATRLGAERFEMVAHHLVQHALCGSLRPVR